VSEFEKAPSASKRTLVSMDKSIDELDRKIEAIAKRYSLHERLLEMDGVGETLAPALVCCFSDKSFENSIRLSLRRNGRAVRQSGKFEGRRKLTKRGPAFSRRPLYCASNSLTT